MGPVLACFLVFLLILVFIGGIGIGIGFLVHWLIPEIGVDIGSLIGVITFIFSFHFFSRLMSALPINPDDVGEDDSDSETVVLRRVRRTRAAMRKK